MIRKKRKGGDNDDDDNEHCKEVPHTDTGVECTDKHSEQIEDAPNPDIQAKAKQPRGWNESWKIGRPWLELVNGKMICAWCKMYMSSNEKAHKSAFIKGEEFTKGSFHAKSTNGPHMTPSENSEKILTCSPYR